MVTGKPLVIIDFSHTSMRMVFTAIAQTRPKKKDGKFITADFIQYYKYLVFNSLQHVKNKFIGDVVLAIDSKNNWRKEFYSEYKLNRKKGKDDSEIDFESFFVEVDSVVDTIRDSFPFKVVKVETAEADDIAGTIALKYGNERQIILVTSDHDWSQVLTYTNTKIWDPIKKIFTTLSDFEHAILETEFGPMSRFTLTHCLIGDKGDNVPSITGNTEFSDSFKTHLSNNEIMSSCVQEVTAMEIFDELVEKFGVYKITKSGKLKGQATDTKDIFKTVPFGIKKAEKILKSSETLKDFLETHKMYKDNFRRNRVLVDFDKIPEELKSAILVEFNSVKINYNPNEMLNYFITENLSQLVSNINKFYDASLIDGAICTSSLDDFF